MQQEAPQTHHQISQDVMIMNQFYFSLFPNIILEIHMQKINPREPPQVYSLFLATPLFFTESTDQRLKYILKAISCHLCSNLIIGTFIL